MFHVLRVEKLLASFNIGIIIALLHCCLMSFCCQKGKQAGQSAVSKKYVQRGEYIIQCFKFIHQTWYEVCRKSFQKREMWVKTTSSSQKKGETNASTPHVLQNKIDYTHVYSLKKFFKGCVKGNGEGPEGAAALTSTMTPQTQMTPSSMTPQIQLTPLTLTPQTQMTPLTLTPQTQLTPLTLTPQTQLTPLTLTPADTADPVDVDPRRYS